jgi:hypothetical protein
VDAQVGHRVLHVSHGYDGYTLDMVVYACSVTTEPSAVRVHDLRWVRPEQFSQYIRDEIVKWTKVAKAADIKLE